jgi:hypothetical protein
MRGRPLVQWALFCLFWLLLLFPMLRVTGSRGVGDAPAEQDRSQAEQRMVWLTWSFSDSPSSASLKWEGELQWDLAEPNETVLQKRAELPWPEYGPELLIRVEWPDARHRAMELLIEPVEGSPVSITRWTESDYVEERVVLAP